MICTTTAPLMCNVMDQQLHGLESCLQVFEGLLLCARRVGSRPLLIKLWTCQRLVDICFILYLHARKACVQRAV